MPNKNVKTKKTVAKPAPKCAQHMPGDRDRKTPCLACLDLINIAIGVAGILDTPRPQR